MHGNNLIVLLSNVDRTQTEMISFMVNQIYTNVDNTYVLDFNKDNTLSASVFGMPNFIKSNHWEHDNWDSLKEHYSNIVKEFENIFVIKTTTFRGLYTRQLDEKYLIELMNGVVNDNQYQRKNGFIKRQIERFLFLSVCDNKNVYQFSTDTEELDLSNVFKFKRFKRFSVIETDKYDYFPMYEWCMNETYIQQVRKKDSMFFIGSAFTVDREKYLHKYKTGFNENFGTNALGKSSKKSVLFLKTGMFDIYNQSDKRDIKINQDEYMYNLKLSRYTFVPVCYDFRTFNIVRFIEALCCDCIPLVAKENDLDTIWLTYPYFYDIIRESDMIIKDGKSLAKRCMYCEEEDEGLLEQLKTNKTFKLITDRNYVCDSFEKLLKGH